MNRLISHIIALFLFGANPSFAQDHPVVVELFTSQGCSSCPPADRILEELAKRDDIIALALHVDYWDYIGWKDPFGDPSHADRQRAYATVGERRSIYTPEMIIQGQTDVVGAKPMAVSRAIADHQKIPAAVNLSLQIQDGQLAISALALENAKGPYTLHLFRYEPTSTTQIKRGENAGHTYNYHNIVQDWSVLGDWDAKEPLQMMYALSGDLPVVVIVQQRGTGPIAAAARLR